MPSDELRRHLTLAALEIGCLLNTVADDDERDRLHGHVEKVINDELFAGSVNRAAVAGVFPMFGRLALVKGPEGTTTATGGSCLGDERRRSQEVTP